MRAKREVQFDDEEEKRLEMSPTVAKIGTSHFKSLKVLGKGSFGDVYLVERVPGPGDSEETPNLGR